MSDRLKKYVGKMSEGNLKSYYRHVSAKLDTELDLMYARAGKSTKRYIYYSELADLILSVLAKRRRDEK